MKITVASLNPQKINAVKELVLLYDFLKEAKIEGVSVETGFDGQPWTLDEAVAGAIGRARAGFAEADYSFGLESGLFEVPFTKSGYMDVCACAIFDGKQNHLGLSAAFEIPSSIIDIMRTKKVPMSDACKIAGLTNDPKIGSAQGLVGILTNGRLDRLAQTKQAVTTALIHLEKAHLFQTS